MNLRKWRIEFTKCISSEARVEEVGGGEVAYMCLVEGGLFRFVLMQIILGLFWEKYKLDLHLFLSRK